MIRLFVFVFSLLIPQLSIADTDSQGSMWIPQAVKQGLSLELESKFAQSSFEFENDAARKSAAFDFVDRFDKFVWASGVEKLTNLAPTLNYSEFPTSDDALLDAIGRLQLCAMLLTVQLPPYGKPSNQEVELSSITGLTALSMTIFFIQTHRSEPMSTLEPYLTSDAMTKAFDVAQNDQELKRSFVAACAPTIEGLLSDIYQ